MPRLLLALGLWSVCFLNLQSQNDTLRIGRLELGLNVSHVLANFFNSDFPRATLEQYTLGLKYLNPTGMHGWRWHLGGGFNEFTERDDVNRISRSTNDLQLRTKIGYEWHKLIRKNFKLIYGFDALGSFAKVSVESIFQNFGDPFLETTTWEGGGAGFLGFRYEVGRRFAITTESALNVFVRKRTQYVSDNVMRQKTIDDEAFLVQHQLPVSLYLFIKI